MRTVAAALLCFGLIAPLRAHGDAPLQKLTPPDGRFFDDPMAMSSDGHWLATLSTDAASAASLHVFSTDEKSPKSLRADGLPTTVTAVSFLEPTRILITYKQESGARLMGLIVTLAKDVLAVEKKRLGPADAIEVGRHDGRPVISVYVHNAKKVGGEHQITLFSSDGQKQLAKRSLSETGEGLFRTKAGELRPLWWSHGHTQLAAQKIGEYDKARDMRRPDRFVRIDVAADKTVLEEEIADPMKFTKTVLDHKTNPDAELFVRASEDHKEVVVTDGLVQRPLSLERPIGTYALDSLRSQIVDEKRVLVSLQVEPNNSAALSRHTPDADDLDFYLVERSAGSTSPMTTRRALTLPGLGRPATCVSAANKLAVLRKGKGFDRGGGSIELYVVP